jgi:hypothetical protein
LFPSLNQNLGCHKFKDNPGDATADNTGDGLMAKGIHGGSCHDKINASSVAWTDWKNSGISAQLNLHCSY